MTLWPKAIIYERSFSIERIRVSDVDYVNDPTKHSNIESQRGTKNI